MAMYYYASKLNEASCSGCHLKAQPVQPNPSMSHRPVASSSIESNALLHGAALSYYDQDDYYSMSRGPKFKGDQYCKHVIMNGGNTSMQLSVQGKSDDQQASHLQAVAGKSSPIPPIPKDGSSSEGMELEVEYRDGQLMSATLDALIDMLRPCASKMFTFAFLLSSRLYIKPHELLGKLCKRHLKSSDKQNTRYFCEADGQEAANSELAEVRKLVRILGDWTLNFPYDFRDDRMMALVRTITQRCASEHMASVRDEVSMMLQKLLERLTALEQYEESLVETPQVGSTEQLPAGDILTLGLTPTELAGQLTLVELHRLSFIGPEEFVQAFAPASTATTAGSGVGEIKSTRNLEAYADWFNRLSYLVTTDILKAVKTKYRVRVLEQWVMCARECFNLGNFNSLMAIVSALNMSPVSRLKKTWTRVSPVAQQQLRHLERCLDPGGNHARYRAARSAAGAAATAPLLSVTCRDLHFVNQTAPTKLSGNRINFEKCRALARHVSDQLARRRLVDDNEDSGGAPTVIMVPDNQPPHEQTWRYLNEKPTLTEHGMELVSFEREAPTDHVEKERYKKLRINVT